MSISSAMRMSSSGMTAERFRMDVISSNIANANTTNLKDGTQAYRRRDVLFVSDQNGVRIAGLVEDQSPFVQKHEPGNPNADANGNVFYSNVQPVVEMVNMLTASRAYEANIAAFNSAKSMIRSALNIGKV